MLTSSLGYYFSNLKSAMDWLNVQININKYTIIMKILYFLLKKYFLIKLKR